MDTASKLEILFFGRRVMHNSIRVMFCTKYSSVGLKARQKDSEEETSFGSDEGIWAGTSLALASVSIILLGFFLKQERAMLSAKAYFMKTSLVSASNRSSGNNNRYRSILGQ